MADRHLLFVWNPLLSPTAVRDHVKVLRRPCSDGPRHVWWGRLYQGRRADTELLDKWSELATLVKTHRESGKELIVFVTDYTSLHVMRVDRVILPTEPGPPPGRLPAYYEGKPRVPLWLRVRDIRVLSYRQISTLEYLYQHLKEGDYGYGFDPYAAREFYFPIVVKPVESVSLETLFCDSRHDMVDRLFADDDDVLAEPRVREAEKRAKQVMGPLWNDLESSSRVFLASSSAVELADSWEAQGFDLSNALVGLAKAVEVELVEGVLHPAARLQDPKLVKLLAEARQKVGHFTLGSWCILRNRAFQSAARRASPALDALVKDQDWRTWMTSFAELRNTALHRGIVSIEQYASARDRLIAPESLSALSPLVTAKRELLRC